MGKLKEFWHFIRLAEDVWSVISLFLQLGVGSFMISLFLKLTQLPSPWRELIFVLGIFALVVFLYSLTRLILAFRRRETLTRLYENRASLPPFAAECEKAKEIWMQWRVGSTAKNLSAELWNNPHFTRLLIQHPKPTKGKPYYLEAHMLSFPTLALKGMCEDIYTATRQAPKHIDVRWFNGYLGDSLLIVNPHDAKKNGWVRIEIASPFSQGDDRPSIIVKEKQYPTLFRILVNNYKSTFDKAEKPPDREAIKHSLE